MAQRLPDLACKEQSCVEDRGCDHDRPSPRELPDHPLGTPEDGGEEDRTKKEKVEDPDQRPYVGARSESAEQNAVIWRVVFEEVDRKVR